MNPLAQLPIPLLEWYQENARVLPWRSQPTPYRVWVSEIMLQQTRVTAVLGYFARFMDTFPTPVELAQASEDQLMKVWQGLGYYSRARNLQKAAKQILEQFNGVFPETYEELRTLAGIGDYTAAAISSIAFGLPYPAVDGNLLRVTARITGDADDITTIAMKRKVTIALTEIIPHNCPGTFNQAMMDLGAMICLPNGAPLCDRCPAIDFCIAYQTDQTATLPVRASKKARRIEDRTVFFIFWEKHVALRRRPPKGLLAGLWEFPCEPAPAQAVADTWGIPSKETYFGGEGRHVFTHIEWHMTAKIWITDHPTLPSDWVWADFATLNGTYAIPSAFTPFQHIWNEYL